jgi:aryl-alcohol dehydrogenase-like predicted oxidoreductase
VLASDLGTTMAKLSLAWCLKNPNVSTVILGASNEKQLKENLQAMEIQSLLTSEVMNQLEDIMDNKPTRPDY